MDSNLSNVKKYYSGKTLFITGVTGFVGLLLLEKLLESDIKKIYLLIREKKGNTAESRLKELVNSIVFDKVRSKNPNFADKTSLVKGDIMIENLGISMEDEDTLIREVDCVFHCAANVNFNTKLKAVAYANVRCTRDLLRLSRRMQHLEAFIYVSTAYSNCVHKEIQEVFYKPPMTGDQLLSLVDMCDDDVLDTITPSIIGKWPNAYVYSKCVSESILKKEGKKLPIAIIRPSNIMSTYKEPIQGWVNNVYGPIGVSTLIAIGWVHALNCRKDVVLDMVPADYVVNSIIVAAWSIGNERSCNSKLEKCQREKDIPIFNIVSPPQNSCTIERLYKGIMLNSQKVPSRFIMWYPFTILIYSTKLYRLLEFVFHLVPAYLIDMSASCFGKQPMLLKRYRKIAKLLDVLGYFMNQEWKFCNKNAQGLWNKLSAEDRRLYCFNMNDFDWKDYFSAFVGGIRVYVSNDPMNTLPQGRRKYQILKTVHYSLIGLLVYGFYIVISLLFSVY